MPDKQTFAAAVAAGYTFKGESVKIGGAMLNGEVVPGAEVFLPLKTMNRHGLIAGATGTGKTKTLQMMSEALSDASVPTLLLDIKGDLSGIAMPGTPNEKISERSSMIGVPYSASGYPVELMTLTNSGG